VIATSTITEQLMTITPPLKALEKSCGLSPQTLGELGLNSVQDVLALTESAFVSQCAHALTIGGARAVHRTAQAAQQQLIKLFHAPTAVTVKQGERAAIGSVFDATAPTWQSQFPDHAALVMPGSLGDSSSPASYATSLYALATGLETITPNADKRISLAIRRPDLGATLLNEVTVYQALPKLDIVNGILQSGLADSHNNQALVQNLQQQHVLPASITQLPVDALLARLHYPGRALPFHEPHAQIVSGLAQRHTDLPHLCTTVHANELSFCSAECDFENANRALLQAARLSPAMVRLISEAPLASASLDDFFPYNFGVATGASLNAFTALSQATGLSASELMALLCAAGVGATNSTVVVSANVPALAESTAVPYAYGAVYIHGGKTPVLYPKRDTDSAPITVAGLTNPDGTVLYDRYDRINRLARLQRHSGLPVPQLDALVVAAMRAEGEQNLPLNLNIHTVRTLGFYHCWRAAYGLEAEDLSSILFQITPYAVGTALPQLDRLFNPRSQANQAPLTFDDTPFNFRATDGNDASTVRQLCAGLKTSETDFLLLADQVNAAHKLAKDQLTRSLGVVSALYRLSTIAALLGLRINELLTLLTLLPRGATLLAQLAGVPQLAALDSNGQPSVPDLLNDLQTLAALVSWLQSQQLAVADLALLLVPPSALSAGPAEVALINDINQHLNNIRCNAASLQSLGLTNRDTAGAPLDWLALLTDKTTGVIDQYGLVRVENQSARSAAIKGIVDAQKLDDDDKAGAITALNNGLDSVLASQQALTDAQLGKLLATTHGAVLAMLACLSLSSYGVLSLCQTLDKPGVTAADIPPAFMAQLNSLGRYSLLVARYRLTPATLATMSELPGAFGSTISLSLDLLPVLADYFAWRHLAGNEDRVLQYLRSANASTPPCATAATTALAELLGADTHDVQQAINVATGSTGSGLVTRVAQVGHVMRLLDCAKATGLSVNLLSQITALDITESALTGDVTHDAAFDSWRSAALAVTATLNRHVDGDQPPPPTGLAVERKRNALEDAWLGQLSRIPGSTATPLNTPDDLYNYLLIDTRSGWQQITSVVAQVVASLQQYINNILFGSEPGYTHVRWQQEHAALLEDWHDITAQYDTWAANVMLTQYPENYLVPPLRPGQSSDFAQMVSDLNQGPLNDNTILAAVQGYLNRFEEVANLSVVSGYVAGTDLTQDDYYFLGCTASKPRTYYWRKCAMHLNSVTTMVPDAWSEWLKVDLPLGGDNVVGLPRPVVQNSRLYVVWFERRATDIKDPKTPQSTTPTLTLSAQIAYLKFDGTWSVPQMLGSTVGTAIDSGDGLYSSKATFSTLALQFTDASANPFLYIGLYSSADAQCPTTGIANDKAMVCALDAWMNLVKPQADAINAFFTLYAAQTPARQNHNATAVNPNASSQQFLQRATALSSALDSHVTNSALVVDELGLGTSMPTMKAAGGKTALPNTVVIDTSTLENSRLLIDFTPGQLTVPFLGVAYGDATLKFIFEDPTSSLAMSYFAVFMSTVVTLTITISDDKTYQLLKACGGVLLGNDIPGWPSPFRTPTNSVSVNDSKRQITARFERTTYYNLQPDNLIQITVGYPSVIAEINLGAGQRSLIKPADCLLNCLLLNDTTVLASVPIKGVTTQASDHCSATLANLDLSQHSDFTFALSTRIELWTGDRKTLLGSTARQALTALHFEKSLNPATDPMPLLDSYSDPVLGTAEFLHFDLKAGADNKAAFAPENIRLNTLFAKQLVKSAQNGLDLLFDWNTQLTPEPDLGTGVWLTLTLPVYNPDTHGDNRACTVVMYPKDNLSYPLAEGWLGDSSKPLQVFLPFNDSLMLDVKDDHGTTYQVLRVYLQTEKTAFNDNNGSVLVACKQDGTPITAKILNAVPAGFFQHFAGFANAATQPASTTPMDFSDANGLYFWELYYHTPAMVAYTLQARGQFADAHRWQQRLFDPSAINQGTDRQGNPIGDYWKVVPISPGYAKKVPSYAIEGPTDPDALAYADPQHFRKASYMSHVQTHIALGDFYYRQLTPDSLNQALQLYTQTNVLLGPRPDTNVVSPWAPLTLQQAASQVPHGDHLALFEQKLCELPDHWASYPTNTRYAALHARPSGAFYSPFNTHLLQLWDTLDSRRYNLRHNLDINGNPLHLPLFANPLDPGAALASAAQGGTNADTNGGAPITIAPYRYNVMSEKARDASSVLSEFGQQLLRALEAKDQCHEDLLGQSQLADLWTFIKQTQQQAVDLANNGLDTLTLSLAAAQQRHDFYQGLLDDGRSALESAALKTLATGSILMSSVAIPSIAAGVVALAPNIFGLADGGSNWAGPLKGVAEGTMSLGFAASAASEAMAMQAGFDRRQSEWQQQANQALQDIATLNSQITGQRLQIAASKTAQALATTQHQQVMAMYTFLSSRFTNEALYQWLIGQLSALYYQAYDATLSLCTAAQTCWQYELGDFTSSFIPSSSWNSHYQGLLAGETLRLSLLQMDSAWLARNSRTLNITRSFSLREKLGEQAWAAFVAELKTGQATFSLSEQDFDLDYPGHYLRQIASVSVSLPALVGPYQNVRATLTQTGSSLVLKADLEAIKHLKDSTTGSAANLKRNLNASQQIALSAGLDDNGTFVMNSNDGRYLPFEGTGAVSDWVLGLPNPGSSAQQQVLDSLNDVVVTLRYTALDGGSSFAEQVLKLWSPSQPAAKP
jgi:hypothetical protein